MIRVSVIAFAFLLLGQMAFSQRITFTKTFGGMGFEMDTVSLSMKQVLEVMRINPVAHDEFKKARSYNSAAGILGFAGAILISIPLVAGVAGSHPEWSLAAAGGALIIASIPLNRAFQRHTYNALDLYNKQFESGRLQTHLLLSAAGARLIIRF